MSNIETISVTKRQTLGRKVKQLRKSSILPANIFGKKISSIPIQLSYDTFMSLFDKVGETGLVNLTIEGNPKPYSVLISDIQYHPVTDKIIHADFRHVDLTEKITASVPVEIVGVSPAVKDLGCVLVTPLDELEIKALPSDFPDSILVDISALTEINSSISAGDLKLDSKIQLITDPETTLAIVQPHVVEEESTPASQEPDPSQPSKPTKEGETDKSPEPSK